MRRPESSLSSAATMKSLIGEEAMVGSFRKACSPTRSLAFCESNHFLRICFSGSLTAQQKTTDVVEVCEDFRLLLSLVVQLFVEEPLEVWVTRFYMLPALS